MRRPTPVPLALPQTTPPPNTCKHAHPLLMQSIVAGHLLLRQPPSPLQRALSTSPTALPCKTNHTRHTSTCSTSRTHAHLGFDENNKSKPINSAQASKNIAAGPAQLCVVQLSIECCQPCHSGIPDHFGKWPSLQLWVLPQTALCKRYVARAASTTQAHRPASDWPAPKF